MAGDRPPAGWAYIGGVITPGDRVCDYAARLQSVKASCRAKGCSRRIDIDPEEQVRAGLGAVSMRRLSRLWACHRLDGCELSFFDERPGNPLCLHHFVGRPNVRVRLKCRGKGCKFFQVYRVEQIIAGLMARGAGDERTEVDKLGALMTAGCPLCKRANWTADVLWIDTGTEGWKRLGERNFEARNIEEREQPSLARAPREDASGTACVKPGVKPPGS